jgi:hypothetical protein
MVKQKANRQKKDKSKPKRKPKKDTQKVKIINPKEPVISSAQNGKGLEWAELKEKTEEVKTYKYACKKHELKFETREEFIAHMSEHGWIQSKYYPTIYPLVLGISYLLRNVVVKTALGAVIGFLLIQIVAVPYILPAYQTYLEPHSPWYHPPQKPNVIMTVTRVWQNVSLVYYNSLDVNNSCKLGFCSFYLSPLWNDSEYELLIVREANETYYPERIPPSMYYPSKNYPYTYWVSISNLGQVDTNTSVSGSIFVYSDKIKCIQNETTAGLHVDCTNTNSPFYQRIYFYTLGSLKSGDAYDFEFLARNEVNPAISCNYDLSNCAIYFYDEDIFRITPPFSFNFGGISYETPNVTGKNDIFMYIPQSRNWSSLNEMFNLTGAIVSYNVNFTED